MRDEEYITIAADSYDDLIAKYLKALDRIMDLEIELYEMQERSLEKANE